MMVKADSLHYGRVPRDAFNVQSFDIVNIGTDTLHVSEGSIGSTAFIANETEYKMKTVIGFVSMTIN
mgnify:CR=1 FL=1